MLTETFQLSLFQKPQTGQVVNVASVPQRSPFRYPGGKTWLVPVIRQWLLKQPKPPEELVEPFAGGAIIGLTAAFEGLARYVTLVELDEDVAAVWQTILEGDYQSLAQQIVSFTATEEALLKALACPPTSCHERAFQTILRNRTQRGGILASGAGKIRHGENGRGLFSRWYPQTLSRRIIEIGQIRGRIRFIHGDGMSILQQYAHQKEAVFFLDPPYTADGKRAGSRLYRHSCLDHNKLFHLAEGLAGDFLMTYDDSAGVQQLAQQHGLMHCSIPMKNTHHSLMQELLIGRDLSWLF